MGFKLVKEEKTVVKRLFIRKVYTFGVAHET